jgi:hypothetical protein
MKVAARAVAFLPVAVSAQTPALGTEEYGFSPRQLVQAIERTEQLISQCMREQGFQYVAADHDTVRAGMSADKRVPGLSEEQFTRQFGFGISTTYTGAPPQLATGYSPAKVGLGEQNVAYFQGLPPTGQAAYNHALLGEPGNPTFAVALEQELLSQTGGCTRKAVEQVFKPEHLTATYYNPQDTLINKDRRMKAALAVYAREMKKAGFEFSHPDEVERDIRARLAALTDNGRISVDRMNQDQKTALKRLQDFERAVAVKSVKLQDEILTPVEEKIQQEMFSRKPQ